MAFGVLTARQDNDVECQLSEGSAADAAELRTDTFLGGFELLTDETSVAVTLGLLSKSIFIGTWCDAGCLHHTLPRDCEAWMRAIVAEFQ